LKSGRPWVGIVVWPEVAFEFSLDGIGSSGNVREKGAAESGMVNWPFVLLAATWEGAGAGAGVGGSVNAHGAAAGPVLLPASLACAVS
jgi:hypothetical protein